MGEGEKAPERIMAGDWEQGIVGDQTVSELQGGCVEAPATIPGWTEYVRADIAAERIEALVMGEGESKVTFRCDGCGKTAPGYFGQGCEAHKPPDWYARRDNDGVQIACSRACITKIAHATGKTRVVLPI